jgi:hypothetical protein
VVSNVGTQSGEEATLPLRLNHLSGSCHSGLARVTLASTESLEFEENQQL